MSRHPNVNPIRVTIAPILCGLFTAHTIATIFIYLSNSSIYAAADAIGRAGFFPVPAGPALATLKHYGTALWGGLFFTLSIGVGLTLSTWGALCLWAYRFKRHTLVMAVYIALWVTLLIYVNFNGWTLFPTLFCLLVPATVAGSTIIGLRRTAYSSPPLWFIPVATLMLLTALWATQWNTDLFTTIRDHILLSNPVGRSVNDFYYRNTLYAAEAFKSFEQKTMRTSKLEGFSDDRQRRILMMRLAKHDVLVLEGVDRPDITLSHSDPHVVLTSAEGTTLETTLSQFMSAPRNWLRKFSGKSDRLTHFRKMTLLGLLLGFPILLFVLVYSLMLLGLAWVTADRRAVSIASALCLGIGIMLFLPMLNVRPLKISNDRVNQTLASDQWTHRVAALRQIEAHQLEIARYPAYRNLLTSGLVVERYWLARALAKSRAASTYPHLLTLLKDPHPNVICQVFYALGERGQRRAIAPIKQTLLTSDHWYAQWYGYGALRRLGWHQGQ